jgi:hypothetical protein
MTLGIAAAVFVLVIGLGAYLAFGTKQATEPNASLTRPSAEQPPKAPPPPKQVRLSDVWASAIVRARAWHEDAKLVRVEAAGADESGIFTFDGTATISFRFGKPIELAAPSDRVSAEQLRIDIKEDGLEASNVKGAATTGLAEPSCLAEDAIEKARASGLDSGGPLRLVYELNREHGKPSWTISKPSGSGKNSRRTLDAFTCAIRVR